MSIQKLNDALGLGDKGIDGFLADLNVDNSSFQDKFSEIDSKVKENVDNIDNQIQEYNKGGLECLDVANLNTSLSELKELIVENFIIILRIFKMKNHLIVYSYEPSGSCWNTPDIRYGNHIFQVESLNVKKIDEIINFLQNNVNTNVTIHNIIRLDEWIFVNNNVLISQRLIHITNLKIQLVVGTN